MFDRDLKQQHKQRCRTGFALYSERNPAAQMEKSNANFSSWSSKPGKTRSGY